jgi:hypothetical protein
MDFFANVPSSCRLQEDEFSFVLLHNYTSKTNGTPSFMVAVFWYTLYQPVALQSLLFVKYSIQKCFSKSVLFVDYLKTLSVSTWAATDKCERVWNEAVFV